MPLTNRHHLPEPILRALENDPYPTGKTGDLSVTQLIDAPQIRILERHHRHEIQEDAADRIFSLMGQLTHTLLERAAEPEAITETRLFAPIGGWTVSGQIDRIAPDGTLQDYKLTSTARLEDPREWTAQLNALAGLAEYHGHRIRRLQIVALLRDWNRHKAKTDRYPRAPVVVIGLKKWAFRERREYLEERVSLHQHADRLFALGRPLPPCTPAERWETPTTYAVRKPGRKTALRVFQSQTAAAELAATVKGGYLETRPGEARRCAGFCPVADHCPQWRADDY